VFAAIFALILAAHPAQDQRARLLSDYRAVHSDLDRGSPDSRTLNRAWRIIGDWTALYLASHPNASARDIVDAVRQLDGIEAQVVPLDRDAWAVSASYIHGGTFFVVAHDGVRWSIKDLAARHSRDEIGNWVSYRVGWGDGPLVGIVGHLASNKNGRPRFYVDATAAAAAGGTFRKQISVWEWDGRTASPSFIRSYWVSLDTPPNAFSDRLITIHAKGEFKSFSSCGACTEPEVVWQIHATPGGVTNTQPEFVDKELKACDELWDAVIHRRPTRDIASPNVIAILRKIVPSSPDHNLGMLMKHEVTHSKGRTILTLSTNNLPCSSIRFEIEERHGVAYFSDARTLKCS